ncbi:signal peptidase II [Streptomyces alkaliphilus]|uniref:Lipoprotein signal peptidase n=1 Tax=Streptomyces alkaliphilus TaxID=1472722 RepID=A0A7W3T9H0_9ACTN|nr:signal peptidase II [Streptomyces alkaliphilus]MBB0242597.1 signal peptidase II [Streptomyces alkaliphilus]
MTDAERTINPPDEIPAADDRGTPSEASADARPGERPAPAQPTAASGDGASGEPADRTSDGAPGGAGETGKSGDPGTPDSEDGKSTPVARGRRRIGVLAAIAGVVYLLDLISKIIVVEWLEHRPPIEILGEWLRFEAVRNSGAAFGMGQALTVVFTAIATIVILVIIRLARKLYSTPWAIALGLLLGGALGNLTDRIFRAPGVFQGAVVDFIAPKHFAVFNLADSAIVCGGILIVLLSFRGLDPDGTVHRD